MNDATSPARRCRRRRPLALFLSIVSFSSVIASSRSALPAEFCTATSTGWCVAQRFAGSVPRGELGFRFGEPLDVDGDGRADVAAGARFKLLLGTSQSGNAEVWSGASGKVMRTWEGEWIDGLFGHWVMAIPDISGDALADVVIAAPHAGVDGQQRGIVVARSPKTGELIWKRPGPNPDDDNFGWDMADARDQNGDGHADLFVGSPAYQSGRVNLLSGKDGSVLRTYAPEKEGASFGWYVARLDDLDGDGRADLVVGAPFAVHGDGVNAGKAFVLSSANGKELWTWKGTDPRGGFGGVVAAAGDLDGDGKSDVAVAAPGTEDQTRSIPGEVWVYSATSGKELRHWSGKQPGELFGRMLVDAGDLNGDGVDDLAIGAPYHRRGDADLVGRVEFRSGRTGELLSELFGDGADCWFGWHIRRAPDPDGLKRPTLLIASLRHPVDGNVGVGVLDLYVLRPPADSPKKDI